MADPTFCTLTGAESFKASEAAWRFYTDQPIGDREWLAGSQNLKPPIGYTRNSFETRQFGYFAADTPTVPKINNVPVNLDWLLDDALQRELYARGKCQNDFFRDAHFYFRRNLADPSKNVIAIPDTRGISANALRGLSVMNFDFEAKGTDDKYTVAFEMTQNITWLYTLLHIPDASTDFTFASPGGGDTITRTTGSWVTDGVLAGQVLYVDDEYVGIGNESNNFQNIVKVANVTPLVLTMEDDGVLVAEAPVATHILRIGYDL